MFPFLHDFLMSCFSQHLKVPKQILAISTHMTPKLVPLNLDLNTTPTIYFSRIYLKIMTYAWDPSSTIVMLSMLVSDSLFILSGNWWVSFALIPLRLHLCHYWYLLDKPQKKTSKSAELCIIYGIISSRVCIGENVISYFHVHVLVWKIEMILPVF